MWHRSLFSSGEDPVKVADSHQSTQNENHSRLTPCRSGSSGQRLLDTLSLRAAANKKKKKKSHFEKIISSLCHYPEGTFSVSVQWIIVHILKRKCLFWQKSNIENSH